MNKILIISYEFPPDIGGAGIVAYDYANYLSNSGFDITIVTKYNKFRKINKYPFRIKQIKILPKLYSFQFYLQFVLSGFIRYNFIILNDIAGFLTAAFFFNLKLQQKCIVYMHGGEVDEIFRKPSKLNIFFNFTSRYRRLLKNSHHIIFVSHFLKHIFFLNVNIPGIADKFSIITNGVDSNLFYPFKTNLHDILSIPCNCKILLSAGRIVKEKGYDKMYNIFHKLVKDDSSFHWLIIGTGPYIQFLEQWSNTDGISQNISILQNISRDNLKLYYSSADVFWLLSEYESFGLVYIESASCGTPVIARNAYGAIESVKNNVSGFLVNSDDECNEILRTERYNTLNKKAIVDFASNFHTSKTLSKLIDILQ